MIECKREGEVVDWNHELTDGEFERVCVFVKRGKSVDEAVQLVISDREDDE